MLFVAIWYAPFLDNHYDKLSFGQQVYFPELLAPLLRTLLHLAAIHSPGIIISYKIRSLPKFWTACGLYFTFQPVLIRRDWDSDWECFGLSFEDAMFTFVAHRRPESRQLSIPSSENQMYNTLE
ncbi:hypothetical protein BDZ89DRAFT_330613 [Hymenopellis radicata]|nr:hypothetical protein BDZ89DRAFT_330613 [Hymenopellis radicata]